MAEDDFEIEYLDEDEDVVQQCVQNAPETTLPTAINVPGLMQTIKVETPQTYSAPLLVERTRQYKKKRNRDEEDSDYDPSEDILPEKKRPYNKKKPTPSKTYYSIKTYETPIRKPKPPGLTKKEELISRKSLSIKIPDFNDPLCLPVKALIKDENELKKLRNWNNLCLNHFKNLSTSLKPDSGEAASSKRTVVLRSVKNKLTGKAETTIWSKLTVGNEQSQKKSEVFQSVLPKYREAKILDFQTVAARKNRPVRNVETVILTKEEDKEETLVAYKPGEALSAVYKLFKGDEFDLLEDDGDEKKSYMQEMTVCKVCPPCYQASWRGYKKTDKKKNVICPICTRSFISVYNLLAHVKTHSSEDVRSYKNILCKTLASVVDYHYKCRICQHRYPSIKELRRHVKTHEISETYLCEVGNHMVRSTGNII